MLKVTYPGEQFIWCSLLPLSQSNLGHPPTLPPPPQKKNGKWGKPEQSFPCRCTWRARSAPVLCCLVMLLPGSLQAAEGFLLLLLPVLFQIRVSSSLMPTLLLRPCGYSTDQRGSSGLKQALFMLRVSEALSRKKWWLAVRLAATALNIVGPWRSVRTNLDPCLGGGAGPLTSSFLSFWWGETGGELMRNRMNFIEVVCSVYCGSDHLGIKHNFPGLPNKFGVNWMLLFGEKQNLKRM